MALGKVGRAQISAGLRPNLWVVLFRKEDYVGNPVFQYHQTSFHIDADPNNTANVTVVVQDSADGVTWTSRWTSSALVPGGHMDVSVNLVNRHVRVVCYSTGSGRVDATVVDPEDQVLPGLWPDVGSFDPTSEYA